MINADGENVDLYIPRKCSWTNRLITCKDHAAIQVNVGHLGPDGTYNGNYSTFAISGYVRNKGESDCAMDHLWQKKKGNN
jgi:small subunit ribosomal protein S21e